MIRKSANADLRIVVRMIYNSPQNNKNRFEDHLRSLSELKFEISFFLYLPFREIFNQTPILRHHQILSLYRG